MCQDNANIISLPESSHPYAVNISLTLGNNVELIMDSPLAQFPFAGNHIIRIVREHTNNREQANHLKRISVRLEAFSSACEAEHAGKMLALSLLWVAASKRITLTFERWTGKFPFTIRDRTQATGIEVHGEGRGFQEVEPKELHCIAEEAYKLNLDVPTVLLTSMEFFAAARLEITERARFISLMTALEALSEQHDYGKEIASLLAGLAFQLESSPLLAGQDKNDMRDSLSNRLKNLRTESVRRAIKRTVQKHLSDENIIRSIDEAYNIRSKILHEGIMMPDLDSITHRLEDSIRQIYSSILGLQLRIPI